MQRDAPQRDFRIKEPGLFIDYLFELDYDLISSDKDTQIVHKGILSNF